MQTFGDAGVGSGPEEGLCHADAKGRARVKVWHMGRVKLFKGKGGVIGAARQDAGRVKAAAKRDDPAGGPAPQRGFQTDAACQAGRDAHRTTGVGAKSHKRCALDDRHPGTAAGAAGRAVGRAVCRVPWHWMVTAGAQTAIGKLHRVGLADNHPKLVSHGLNDGPLLCPDLGQSTGRSGEGRKACNTVKVLERHRNALQPAKPDPCREGRIGGGGLLAGKVGDIGDIGVQRRVMLRQGRVEQIAGPQGAAGHLSGDLAQALGQDRLAHLSTL